MDNRFILLLCGEFRRLAQHTGFLLALLKWLYQEKVPVPRRVVGTSCGATALVLFAMVAKYRQESEAAGERASRRISSIIENLRMWHIFTMPRRIAVALSTAIGIGVASFTSELLVVGPWHRWLQFSFSVMWIMAVTYLMYTFLSAVSVFSTVPLEKTLLQIDWEAVRQSPVEVIILTTDCRTGKPRAYSTKQDVPDYAVFMTKVLRKSMRLPAAFQDYDIDGVASVDGEIASNFPIEYACWPRHAYRVAFFVPYTLEGDWPHGKTTFIPDIVRSMSMQIYRHMNRKINRYRRMRKRHPQGGLPPLRIILTKEEIPSLVFSSFSTESMQAGIDQGKRIFAENLPMIRHELGLDQPTA